MRILRTPHQGFLADHDMIAYYPRWTLSASTWVNETTTLGRLGVNRHLIAANGGFPPGEDASLFNPNRPLGGWFFDGGNDMATEGRTPDDSGYVSNASVGFSAAFWYRMDTAATVVVLERSVLPGGTSTNAVLLQLNWKGDGSTVGQFGLRVQRSSGGVQEFTAPPVPHTGFFGFEIAEARQVRFYSNGQQIGSTATLTSAVSTVAATSASARWFIGGSLNNVSGGSFSSALTDRIEGSIGEVAFWRRPIGPTRMRTAYAGCVQPWDANDLLKSENYVVRTRVLLEDTNGVLQNLSALDGRDWVQEVSCEKDVDDVTATAKISLHRRMGRLADMSPLNTAPSDYTDMLALRRKVRIERAIVPSSWNVVGWEWEPIFEGLVDSWSTTPTSVEVACSDRSASLNDAFILENRAYNFVPTKVAEEVLDRIVSDFEPTLHRGGGLSAVRVGYKGATSRPRVYTEAGTVTTPVFVDSRFMLRYNDVGSGPVMAALQAVADQIGYAVEYRYHEPWAEHRLTMYSPRRTKQIIHETIRQVGPQEVMIEFREPHGLSEHTSLTIAGTTPPVAFLDTAYSASSIMDFYRVCARRVGAATIGTGSGASFGSVGTVTFGYTHLLAPESILDVTPAKSDIGKIRNHAIVRFNRNESASTLAPVFVDVVLGVLSVGFSRSPGNIDPSGNGITFTLNGGTSTATALNGSYSGYVEASGVVVSDVTGAAPDGTYTTNLPVFSSVHLNYREVVSTASVSLAEYGYLPVAVFEGSNLAINTEAEAQRLADNLVADLATPTVEFAFVGKVRPYDLHDVVRIPGDSVKGRWTDNLAAAITGITERYSGGRAEGEYRIRLDQPSRGTAWIERIVLTPARPGPGSNNLSNIADQAERWALADAVKNARRFNFNRRLPQRREMGLRHDQTMVWMSTGSVGFLPTEDNRVGVFKGERFAIDADGAGNSLRPGVTHYVRFGEVDIFGNVSAISGLGVASTATVPAFVPRFVDETASVVATSGGATFSVPPGDWDLVTNLDIDDGTDAAGITQDAYSLYGGAGLLFQMPCDGTVSMHHVSSWFGDPSKVTSSAAWYMLAGWMHIRGFATLGFYGENGVEGVGSTELYKLSASAQVTCSSGDYFQLHWKNASLAGYDTIFSGGSTATTHYGLVSYAVVHQV